MVRVRVRLGLGSQRNKALSPASPIRKPPFSLEPRAASMYGFESPPASVPTEGGDRGS